MASYNTVPAVEEPLLQKPTKSNRKVIVAGVSAAAFVLGALAITASSGDLQRAVRLMRAPRANEVSCGGHLASSCDQCPAGHGAVWCNGDCKWTKNRCVSKEPKLVGTWRSCEGSAQGKNLGVFASASECGPAAAAAGCTMFMFSENHNYWGCRCCHANNNVHPNWDMWTI